MTDFMNPNSEKNRNERRVSVLAMEYLARQINNEDVLDRWLMGGVADGDIPANSMNVNDVDDYYIEPENYAELVGCFLRCMKAAYADGSLYCGAVVGQEKSKED